LHRQHTGYEPDALRIELRSQYVRQDSNLRWEATCPGLNRTPSATRARTFRSTYLSHLHVRVLPSLNVFAHLPIKFFLGHIGSAGFEPAIGSLCTGLEPVAFDQTRPRAFSTPGGGRTRVSGLKNRRDWLVAVCPLHYGSDGPGRNRTVFPTFAGWCRIQWTTSPVSGTRNATKISHTHVWGLRLRLSPTFVFRSLGRTTAGRSLPTAS
jgi:hypothetical protein